MGGFILFFQFFSGKSFLGQVMNEFPWFSWRATRGLDGCGANKLVQGLALASRQV